MTELVTRPEICIGEPVAVAEGVYRLSLPMRANPGHVNSYLLVDDDGMDFIDSGHRTDDTRAMLDAVLAGPLAARGVRRILLTHAHPDHAGNAQWLAERTGAPIVLPDAEHDALHRLWRGSIEHGEEVGAFFQRWGIPEDQVPNILGLLKFFRWGCPALEAPTQTLANGSSVRAANRDWRVHYGYGHTPANAALLSNDGLLITGDHVLPTIYPNISIWWGWSENPLRDYLDSLAQFAQLPVTLALPSHGPLFRKVPERVAEIRAFHRRRMERALAFCRGEPRTAYESIAAVLNKPATGPVIALIVGQVLATLAWLEAEGCVERVSDHPLRFRAMPVAAEILRAQFGETATALAVAEGDDEEGH